MNKKNLCVYGAAVQEADVPLIVLFIYTLCLRDRDKEGVLILITDEKIKA